MKTTTTTTGSFAPLLDFRVMVLAVAAALAFTVNGVDARERSPNRQAGAGEKAPGTTSVQRSRGSDGAVDAVRTGRRG